LLDISFRLFLPLPCKNTKNHAVCQVKTDPMNMLMPYPSKLTDLSHHCTIATIYSYSNMTNLLLIQVSYIFVKEYFVKEYQRKASHRTIRMPGIHTELTELHRTYN